MFPLARFRSSRFPLCVFALSTLLVGCTGTTATVSGLLTHLQASARSNILSSQQTHGNFSDLNACINQLGIHPGIATGDYNMDGSPVFDFSVNTNLINYWKAGGLVGLGHNTPNPITGGGSGDTSNIDAAQMITPGTGQYNSLLAKIDQLAGGLVALKNAGVIVIFRPLLEMDGNWFWWGTGNFSGSQFQALYRIFHDRLVISNGLNNLAFVFSTNGTFSPTTYYPGDQYVDIVGFDAYTDTLASTYGGVYDVMRSAFPNKLFALTEFGSGNPSAGNPSYNAQTLFSDIRIENASHCLCQCLVWDNGRMGVDEISECAGRTQ